MKLSLNYETELWRLVSIKLQIQRLTFINKIHYKNTINKRSRGVGTVDYCLCLNMLVFCTNLKFQRLTSNYSTKI